MKKLLLSVILLASPLWSATSYTTRAGIPKPADHDTNWGPTVRSAFDIIDSSMCIQSNSNTFVSSNTFRGDIGMKNSTTLNFYDTADSSAGSIVNNCGTGGTNLWLKGSNGIAINGNEGPCTFGGIIDLGVYGGTSSSHQRGRFAVMGSSSDATTAYSGFTTTYPIDLSTMWSLPSKDGTNGQVMTTDGSGHLSFAAGGGGSGDVLKAATQVFTGGNTFQSTTTFNGSVGVKNGTSLYLQNSDGTNGASIANPYGLGVQYIDLSSTNGVGINRADSNFHGLSVVEIDVSSDTHLEGNVTISSVVTLSNGVGLSGQVLESAGAGAVPSWQTLPSGGSSALQVTRSGVQITSPTASINFYSGDFNGGASGTTSQIYLNPSTTDFVHAQSTLQSGATFYVSSGTIGSGNFYINSDPSLAVAPFASTGTISINAPSQSTSGGSIRYDITTGTILPNFSLIISSGIVNSKVLQLKGSGSVSGCTSGLLWGGVCLSDTDGKSTFVAMSATTGTFTTNITASSAAVFSGNINISSTVLLNSSAGTNGQVLTSGGPGTIPSWSTVSGTGDMILASTQVVTGAKTYQSSSTFNGTLAISSGILLSGSAGTGGQILQSNGAGTVPTWVSPSGGSGSSTSTVLLNGVILSSPTTSYNFVGLVSGTKPSLNSVVLTVPNQAYQQQDFMLTSVNASSQAIGLNCTALAPCQIRNGSVVYSLTAPATATISGTVTSGSAYWYLTSGNTLTVGHNTGATLNCGAGCSVATGITSFPADSVPLWLSSFTANTWNTVVESMDYRTAYSHTVITPGSGIASSDDPTTGIRTLTTDSTIVPRYFVGATTPTISCTQGRDFYVDTVSSQPYVCVGTNFWSQALSTTTGGGGGGGTPSAPTNSIQFNSASSFGGSANYSEWASSVTNTFTGGEAISYGLTAGTATVYSATSSSQALLVLSTGNAPVLQVSNNVVTISTYIITIATSSTALFAMDISSTGHISSQDIIGSTVTSCGANASVAGSDNKGVITTGAGSPTACTLTFAQPYLNTPVCVCSPNAGAACGVSSSSNASVTFALSVTETKINYICLGSD